MVRPELQMPALSRFVDGTGPVLAGKVFPFCFITIACGAVSGFHSLISSGTTPKTDLQRNTCHPDRLWLHAAGKFRRHYGDDCGLFAQSRRLFRSELPAGIVGKTADAAVKTISGWGFPVTAQADGGHGASGGRSHAFRTHRRRAFAGARHGAHFRARRAAAMPCSDSGTTSPSCSKRSSS